MRNLLVVIGCEPTATPINDSLSELNDGITNESGRESARWTNWSLRNENPPVDTYVQLEWQKEYLMQNIKLWHFTDNQFSVLPGDNNVEAIFCESANFGATRTVIVANHYKYCA